MSKPIGYFCSFTPGDGGLLDEMEQSWGSTFENLNESEKAWMIYRLGFCVWQKMTEEIGDDVEDAMDQAEYQLTPGNALRLIEALVSQLKG